MTALLLAGRWTRPLAESPVSQRSVASQLPSVTGPAMEQNEVAFGPFRFSPTLGLLKDGVAVKVGSRPQAILALLLERAGVVVSNRDIMARVWPGLFVEEANIRVHIGSLRKLLGKNEVGTDYIENIPAQGYRFVGTIRTILSPEAVEGPVVPPSAPPADLSILCLATSTG
ncbi:winged helix-turn-helix domain-containing protein [Azospirillum oryzae]|uniref:winged helix-turn-helix domain-containing protein n=1 Tax=Azospirillum oryzae TaxID=286727 RepID=UPI001ABFBE90|nr:winged helix-turn-helix domain-containing protein [Azospirillum oryzae]